MDYKFPSYLSVIFVFSFCIAPLYGQTGGGSYELGIKPDIWYNDVDGIQIGTRLEGRVAGTDEEGPHRMDLGVWIGTWFPSLPVSYMFRYTEPFPSLSEYGNEFHVRFYSSIREGYHNHGISFKKRWERGFDYLNFLEAEIGYRFEKRFDDKYTLFPILWSDTWKGLIKPELGFQRYGTRAQSNLNISSAINTLDPFYFTLSASFTQEVRLRQNWALRLRLYGATVSEDTHPEYLIFRSSGAEISTLERSLARSKGTVPVGWARSGNIQFAGGPNLRGYTDSDIRSVRNGNPVQFTEVLSVNSELDFPNPIQAGINRTENLEGFLSFRSYIFFDGGTVGTSTVESESTENSIIANAGIGMAFTLNIHDYLGKPRGFVIRYEVPAWLSDPDDDRNFKYRHLIGIGATIMF